MANIHEDIGRGASRGYAGAPAPHIGEAGWEPAIVTRCIVCRARLDSPAFGDCAHPRCPFGEVGR